MSSLYNIKCKLLDKKEEQGEGQLADPQKDPLKRLSIEKALIGGAVEKEYGEVTEETFHKYCIKHNLCSLLDILGHTAKIVGIAEEPEENQEQG